MLPFILLGLLSIPLPPPSDSLHLASSLCSAQTMPVIWVPTPNYYFSVPYDHTHHHGTSRHYPIAFGVGYMDLGGFLAHAVCPTNSCSSILSPSVTAIKALSHTIAFLQEGHEAQLDENGFVDVPEAASGSHTLDPQTAK